MPISASAQSFPVEQGIEVVARSPIVGALDASDPLFWAFAAALVLHLVLGLILWRLPTQPPLHPAEERSVTVTILTPDQVAPARPPAILAVPPQPQPAKPADTAQGLTQATRMMSGAILADPRSRQAREALPGLAPEERIIQLCNIEALQQVRTAARQYAPDIVVAYAFQDLKLSAHGLEADGAAFRSKRHWYNIRFTCDVTPDLAKVVSFAYRIGDPVPQREWASHDLTVDDDPAD